jgi:hypothetical protein
MEPVIEFVIVLFYATGAALATVIVFDYVVDFFGKRL